MTPGTRRTATIDITQPNFTGINRWWSYEEGGIPGVGRWMINAYSGNLIVQVDDMNVPHRGIDLAFRRTYNSFSRHDFAGYDGATEIGQYGNGWTNTWDAHISTNGCPNTGYSWAGFYGFTVHDVDGGRYDYCFNAAGELIPPTGMQGTSLVANPDGGSFYWTKKSGTQYTFYAPYYGGTSTAYSGRIYRVSGRNQNNYIQFSYAWSPDASSSANLTNIYAATDNGGSQATLSFATFGAQQLLSQLTRPDGATITYDYDTAGELISVSKPAPNNSGIPAIETYNGYQSFLMVAGPRWNAGGTNDGGYVAFYMDETTTAQVDGVEWVGIMNFAPTDGTSTLLQPLVATGPITYRWEDVRVTPSYTSFSDTDGHSVVQYLDGAGRPTSRQKYTGSQWLQTIEGWDLSNNLVSSTDERGDETDYAYDASGNAVAVGAPQTLTSQGQFRPTQLFDYDAFNNITAFCDETETHAAGADWTSPPGLSDTLCSSRGIVQARFVYRYPSYEPYGQITTMTSPIGYNRGFAYAASQQNGTDYGLPTAVTGDAITLPDGTTVTPRQSFWYDASGNLRCYDTGNGIWVMSYDALSRLMMRADPDDSSASTGSVCSKTSGQPGWNTQMNYTYYPNGQIQYMESAVQRQADVSSGTMNAAMAYTYDSDGNQITETHHHGCAAISGCTAGVTTRWHDGEGRLVEVMLPYDSQFDYHTYKWMTRYLYDLSSGGTHSLSVPVTSATSAGSTQAYSAYGNLFDTQEYVDIGFSGNDTAPRWVDHLGTAYDALDRQLMTFDVARNTAPATTSVYDAGPTTYGYMASRRIASGESIVSDYDQLGRLASVTFQNDGGATPARNYSYDPNGRVASITSTAGVESYAYDAAGRLSSKTEAASQGGNVIGYGYARNGWRTSLSVAGALNEMLFQYSYRPDGKITQQLVNDSGWKAFTWTYTPAGRALTRIDPANGMAIHPGPYSATGGNAFVPATQAYTANGVLASAVYSNGFSVSGITADLEGNPSPDNSDTMWNGSQWVLTHQAMRNVYNPRGEWNGSISSSTTPPNGLMNVYANGIALQGLQPYPGPYVRGQYNGPNLDPKGQPNMLDGFELSRSGADYSSGQGGVDYVTTNNYDGSGRLLESGTAECPGDPNYPGFYNPNDTDEQFRYDAEGHTIKATLFGSSTSQPQSTCAVVAGTTQVYNYDWGVNGHPSKLTSINSYTVSEYFHWDHDTLLFTSSSPSSGVDDIKIGTFGDLTSDGAVAIYDRSVDGTIVEAHSTFASTRNVSYNDYFSLGASVLRLCGLAFSQPCIVVTEPKPDTLSGWQGVYIQGVRAVEPSLGHWTTPDAYSGSIHDPASQKPYMYERNNSYVYSDPSGYDPYVIFDPNRAYGNGHLMIAVMNPKTGVGTLYSQGPLEPLPGGVRQKFNDEGFKRPGAKPPIITMAQLKSLLNKGDSILTEHTTAEQDAAMNKRAEELIASNHNYNLITCNCDEFVKDVLSVADPQAASELDFAPKVDFLRLMQKGFLSGHPGRSPDGFQDARFRQ